LGILTIRFTNEEVLTDIDRVVARIEKVASTRTKGSWRSAQTRGITITKMNPEDHWTPVPYKYSKDLNTIVKDEPLV
jgi:hypothetical protein